MGDDQKWDELWWPRSRSCRNYSSLSYNVAVTRSKASIWRMLWRRIKREKERMVPCSCSCSCSSSSSTSSSSMRFNYDPHSYSQNFDQGVMWADSDHSIRSFSARFAVSSRFLDKNSFIV